MECGRLWNLLLQNRRRSIGAKRPNGQTVEDTAAIGAFCGYPSACPPGEAVVQYKRNLPGMGREDGLDMTEYLAFLRAVEGLKSVTRTAWTAAGRRESTAEHTWRLALFTALAAENPPGVDAGKAVRMALIHDLGERYTGDLSAATLPDQAEKYKGELAGMKQLAALLPPGEGESLLNLWLEYDRGETAEARLVKALDKAETILQHQQGANPPGFDHGFNLGYGAEWFRGDPALKALRDVLDQGTQLLLGD